MGNYKRLIYSVFTFIACLSIPVLIKAQNKEPKEKTIILFVCEHGAARSVIASAYFNKLAKEKNLSFQAVFRGTTPDSTLSAATVMGLTKDGFNATAWKPLIVTQADLNTALQLITFDCSLPFESSKPISKWNGVPSINKDYDVARNEILKHVQVLINDLEKKK
jgi:arsenate reductase (thioredoxin)